MDPEYVIFGAGSNDSYGHPRAAVAQRFLNSGIELNKLFRTDLGDDESKPEHWENDTTIEGLNDPSGDDNIIIRLTNDGKVTVEYIDEN